MLRTGDKVAHCQAPLFIVAPSRILLLGYYNLCKGMCS